ncbi:hypothetical protein AAMO2058_000465500 [Amorphochlora amoebiformis]
MGAIAVAVRRRRFVCRICVVASTFATILIFFAFREYGTNGGYTGLGEFEGGSRRLLESEADQYPQDAFTKQQLSSGAAILHLLGVLYMFTALAIICDEFFVPSLEVICESLNLQDDVAGATFMAAGGSAPELATSFVGTFVSRSNVGFGTIVGSAVFNILFVIGTCAMYAPSAIQLMWWPLFRDSVFYSISLGSLIGCFWDRQIEPWEAAILLSIYLLYVTFMKFNQPAEAMVRRWLKLEMETGDPEEAEMVTRGERKKFHEEKERISGGLGEVEKTSHPRMTFGIHTLFSSKRREAKLSNPPNISRARRYWTITRIKVMSRIRKKKSFGDIVFMAMADPKTTTPLANSKAQMTHRTDAPIIEERETTHGEEEEDDGPMDLAWPSTTGKRISYVILAPLTFLLYYCIPDVRREGNARYVAVSFCLSVFFIGFFSYFMVWWVTIVGETLTIPSQVMGLTILAIGTSVPDLLESVIVAKQGKGDMAISSSIGSNIFDITIGLPLPWLLYTLINKTPIEVGTNGLFISVILLFAMLISCITSIALSGWRMSKSLGVVFFLLWIVFVTISLVVEFV